MERPTGGIVRCLLAAVLALAVTSLPACLAGDPLHAGGSTYYVSRDGDDANSGSATSPWRTIQRAAGALRPGETAYVRGGVYRERVVVQASGNAGLPIRLAAAPGERPILDGTDLPIPSENAALILIEEQSHVVIDGFGLRNWTAASAGEFPAGILVVGASRDIVIRNCVVHGIGNNLPSVSGDGPFANGIAVYGTAAEPAGEIRIESNELYDLQTGGSEALVVNGNVDGFDIVGNTIHHVNNIAIDCIGFEGIGPDDGVDCARNGRIVGNRIEDVSGRGNQYYAADPYGGLGIYVDGGRDIAIERNAILRVDFGVEIACEHAGWRAAGILLANNIIAECRTVGLSVGGWIDGWGGAADVTIVNNTFFHNDALRAGHGEVALLKHLDRISFRNNVVFANEQGAFILQEARTGSAVDVESNLYVVPGGNADGLWIWDNVEYDGFDEYRAASGNDTASIVADPSFVDPAAYDFRLRSGSPCIDAGGSPASWGDGLDAGGGLRVLDGDADGVPIVDLGAYEFAPATP